MINDAPWYSILSMVASLLLISGCSGTFGRSPTPTFIPRDFTPEVVNDQSAEANPSAPMLEADQAIYYVSPVGNDANAGTIDQPWATINHATEVLRPGDTVLVRGGTYRLTEQVCPKQSGTAQAWITYAGYPGETAILDASAMDSFAPASQPPYPQDNGAFQIEQVSYIRVRNLMVIRSHNAGFTIRDSSNIDLFNNRTDQTFSSGIAAWDTNHDGQGTDHIRILGNTVSKATTWDMIPKGMNKEGEPPHEAISIAGAIDFEVAYNLIYNSDKEGIDVKETSQHGKVHHNLVYDVDRQGLYIDSWFGEIHDIEVYENVVHDCRGAGIIVSVENGKLVEDVRIHHNLIFNNLGAGIFFSRWGDGPRKNIQVYNNTVYHNGYGTPNPPDAYFWMTGGLYLYSTNLQDIDIHDNIFSDNRGYQIAYSGLYLENDLKAEQGINQKNIRIHHNLIDDHNGVKYPIHVGWPPDDYSDAYALDGSDPLHGDPLFINPDNEDFSLKPGSPARDVGVYPIGVQPSFWWQGNFPPSVGANGIN
jgi:hypothetical protein